MEAWVSGASLHKGWHSVNVHSHYFFWNMLEWLLFTLDLHGYLA